MSEAMFQEGHDEDDELPLTGSSRSSGSSLAVCSRSSPARSGLIAFGVLAGALALILVSTANSAQEGPDTIQVVGHLEYTYGYDYRSGVLTYCDFDNQPCAKLNDVWGYEFEENGQTQRFALVGATNGLDIVDVTDPTNPVRVKFIQSCLNNWRDYKVYDKTIYGISEYTQSCNCRSNACVEHMTVLSPPSLQGEIAMTEGRLTPQLEDIGDVAGEVYVVSNWDSESGCLEVQEPPSPGMIFLVPDGICEYRDKVLSAQNAGAAGVIVVNDMDYIVYPGMTGSSEGINIPAVLIGNTDGMELKHAVEAGETVSVVLTADNKRFDSKWGPPEGLLVVDMTNPRDPVWYNNTEWFYFAHNVFVEQDLAGNWMAERPYMYTCGMSDREPDQDGFGDLSNGGIFAYDVSDPLQPVLLSVWNTTYIHDLVVHKCEWQDRYDYYLFGASITDDDVYIINVTDPADFQVVNVFAARQGMAHNVWLDKDCRVMYVTHEEAHEPITVWEFRTDNTGRPRLDVQPQYRGSLSVNQFDGTLPHNVFVDDEVLWCSYYAMGVVAWNISSPAHPELIHQLDTSNFTGGFYGVWGVYPYASSGLIYASDREEGLFITKLSPSTPSTSNQLAIALAASMGTACALLVCT